MPPHSVMDIKMNQASPPGLWTKDFILICLSNFLVFVSFQLLLPTLPLYVNRLGGNEGMVGWIAGAFTLSAVLIRPLIGGMVDRHGRRGIYLIGLLCFFATTWGYLYTVSILPLLLLRVVHGFTWGAVTTTSGAVATDLIPERQRGEGMGYYGLLTNLAVAFGPVLGLWVVDRFSYSLLFVLAAGLVLAAWGTARLIRYPKVPTDISATPSQESEQQSIPRGAWATSIMALLVTFSLGAIVTYLPLFAEEQKIPHVGWFFTVYAITMMAVRPKAGKLFDRQGPRLTIPFGLAAIALSLIQLAIADSMWDLLAAAAFFGAGFGTVHPSLQAWTIQQAPRNATGRANGAFFASFDLGIGIGTICSGFLAEWTRYPPLFLALTLPLILAFLLFLHAEGHRR